MPLAPPPPTLPRAPGMSADIWRASQPRWPALRTCASSDLCGMPGVEGEVWGARCGALDARLSDLRA
eukprot:355410-Chlamydomonas_euryale.AAC.2